MSIGAKSSSVNWERLFPLLLVALVTLTYANSLANSFMFDDGLRILHAPDISRLWPVQVHSRFVTDVTFKLNYFFSGFNTAHYHITNIVILIVSGLLLYGIVRRTLQLPLFGPELQSSASRLAIACASIWAVHPLQTESITYICQRYESLMGMFMLLSLYSFMRSQSSLHKWPWYIASLAACLLGMGTKEGMALAPAIILLYDYVFLSGSFRRIFRERWRFYAALFATMVFLYILYLDYVGELVETGATGRKATLVSPLIYLLTQFGVITHYLKLSIVPYPLCLDYAWPVPVAWREIIWPGAVVITLFGATCWSLAHRRLIAFIGAWFFLTIAPSSTVFPIADAAAEHRMYLPLAAIICAVVFGYNSLRRRFPRMLTASLSMAVLTVILLACSLLTVQRNGDYRSEEGMLSQIVRQRPMNFRAHLGLISCLMDRGRIDEAEIVSKLLLGKLAVAEQDTSLRYRAVAASNVEYYLPHAHNQYGRVLLCLGRINEAKEEFEKAIHLLPDCQVFYHNLAVALALLGKPDEAIHTCELTISVDPNYYRAYAFMASILADQGRYGDAIGRYRKSLELNRDQISTKCELAWLLATCPDDKLRDGARAVQLALSVCQDTGYASIRALDVLAAAYAEKTIKQALDLAASSSTAENTTKNSENTQDEVAERQKSGDKQKLTEEMLSRLRLYQGRSAFRQSPKPLSGEGKNGE